MEKFNTGGLRRHEIIYSLDTGRLMGGPLNRTKLVHEAHVVSLAGLKMKAEIAREIHHGNEEQWLD
jgi:hypothetical protein